MTNELLISRLNPAGFTILCSLRFLFGIDLNNFQILQGRNSLKLVSVLIPNWLGNGYECKMPRWGICLFILCLTSHQLFSRWHEWCKTCVNCCTNKWIYKRGVQKIIIGSQNIIKYPGNGFPSSLEIGYTDKKLTFVCVRRGWGGGVGGVNSCSIIRPKF